MRILIIYASAGIGHKKAAEAIYNAFRLKAPSNEVFIVDALDYSNIIFRWSYPRTYLVLVNHLSLVWGVLYYLTDCRYFDFIFSRLRRLFHRLNGIKLEKFLLGQKPEVVITTHFFPSDVIGGLKKRMRFSGRLITVITDFLSHSFWLSKDSDDFIVAMNESKRDLVKRGIEEKKIKILGIPVGPIFSQNKSRGDISKSLGIKENLFNILIVSGGFGIGPIKALVLNLDRLEGRFNLNIQLLVICGRNERLFGELNLMRKRLKVENRIYGFVDNMDEFMQISDCLITKSGGITVSEALSKNLPMIIIRPILGQETRNSSLLLKYGAAIKADSVLQACRIVKELLDSPERLYGMRTRAKVFAHLDAAIEIASLAISIG